MPLLLPLVGLDRVGLGNEEGGCVTFNVLPAVSTVCTAASLLSASGIVLVVVIDNVKLASMCVDTGQCAYRHIYVHSYVYICVIYK